MERFGKVGQPMRLMANNYFSPPLGTIIEKGADFILLFARWFPPG